jgi:hypothetical protein
MQLDGRVLYNLVDIPVGNKNRIPRAELRVKITVLPEE